jgi:protease PrsW
MELLIAALAPILIFAIYFYYRDKYEKEPVSHSFENFIVRNIYGITCNTP